MKRASIFMLLVFSLIVCAAACSYGELIEVQAQGFGSSRAQAMMNAVEEALRQSMGALFLSREEVINGSLSDKVVQVSRGSVKHSRIVSEKSENGRITLDVMFQIDTSEVIEAAQSVSPEFVSMSEADIVRRPLLKRGRTLIRTFFEGVDLLEFLAVSISDIKIDPDREEFSATLSITLNGEKFSSLFAAPLASMMNDAVLRPELDSELSGEDSSTREAGVIYLLGVNKSFTAWTLPLVFMNELLDSAGIDGFNERNVLQTQRRICVNLSLTDNLGQEVQRLPVMIPITNILMFSSNGYSPWGLLGSVQPKVSIIFAPLFGIRDNTGRRYTSIFADESDPFEVRLVVRLPKATLSRIKNASSWLQIER